MHFSSAGVVTEMRDDPASMVAAQEIVVLEDMNEFQGFIIFGCKKVCQANSVHIVCQRQHKRFPELSPFLTFHQFR